MPESAGLDRCANLVAPIAKLTFYNCRLSVRIERENAHAMAGVTRQSQKPNSIPLAPGFP